MPSEAFEKHGPGCECDKYGCKLRRKGITTRLDTGVTNMAGVRHVSEGQDGSRGRNEGGELL